MKEKLTNNLGIKLLSLLLAAIMWIVIINLDDPIITRTYQNITVEIMNEAAIASIGQVYDVVDGRTVAVTVKGKRSVVDKIKAGDLRASVDLSNISSFNKVEITASCEKYAYENLEITTKPKLMQITLEEKGEKQVNVKVVTTGTPAAGYTVGIAEAKPVMLAISGAESIVARIEEARVSVDVSGETETFTKRGLVPKLYDGEGNEIDASRLTFNKQKISATINILKTKSVPIQIKTKGIPARDYGIYQIDYDPETVEIAGTDRELSEVSSIPIEVDVDNMSADVEQTVLLADYLPKGIRLAENIESVAIKITIRPMQSREFYLTVSDIATKNMPENLNFSFADPESSVRVRIMGMDEVLSGLTAANLGAYIDLQGLGEGTHELEIHFNLDEALHLAEAPKITIKLSGSIPEEPEEEPDTENEGGETE